MKLLRLTSSDPNAIFDSRFNEEILVNEKSKIALHSLSFEQLNRTIAIDADNDEITANYSNSLQKKIQLQHKVYTADNVEYLLSDIQDNLNSSLTITVPNNQGLEWSVVKSQDNKINIFAKKTSLLKRFTGEVLNNMKYGSGLYSLTTTAGSYDSYASSTNFCCRGSGYIRIRSNNANGVVIVGLSTQDPSTVGTMSLNYINYGIYIDKINNCYKNIINGSISNPIENTLETTAWCEVAITDGIIKGTLYKTSVSVNMLSGSYDNETKYYPYVIILGDNTNAVQISYLPSPFTSSSVITTRDETDYSDFTDPLYLPPIWSGQSSNQNIIFESAELSEFLGFNNPTLPVKVVVAMNYKADNLFLLNSYNDSFIVELFDFKLDSYDSQKQSRKSILSVIPSAEINENLTAGVVYEANNLIWININNYEKLNLRNIRLRVYQRDYSPVNMKGLAVMSLLIKDADE